MLESAIRQKIVQQLLISSLLRRKETRSFKPVCLHTTLEDTYFVKHVP